jgi:hypothetical protein
MKELEEIGSALEAEIVKEDLRGIIGDLSETSIQAIGEGIPGLSMLFKFHKAFLSIKDYFLMDKVLVFLSEMSKMPTDSRKELISKINTDPIYGQKFGAFVLTALDRHDFAEKSVYLARACRLYENNSLNKEQFILIKSMIENLHLVHIKRWMDSYGLSFPNDSDDAYNHFLSNGVIKTEYKFNELLRKKADQEFDINRKVVKTSLTHLGRVLYHIVQGKDVSEWTLFALQRR